MSSWRGSIASHDSRARTSTSRGQAHLQFNTRRTARRRRKETLRSRGPVSPVIFSALAVQDFLVAVHNNGLQYFLTIEKS